MTAEALLPYLLVAQAAMGGIDTLVNHEWIAKLPRRTSARREMALHSVREATYGTRRVLPQNERVLHVFLTLNYGLIVALLVPTLLDWSSRPAGLERAFHGWTSWALALLGASSFAWSLRDLLAWRRLSIA